VNENNPSPVTVKQKQKQKTTKKTKKLKKGYYRTYWSKKGVSPDNKHSKVMAIARPSGWDYNKYNYKQLYNTVFKNYCPSCKRSGVLEFNKNPTKEHNIKCKHCGTLYCGVTGAKYGAQSKTRLTVTTKPVKSNKSEYGKLINGKIEYGQEKKSNKKKKVTSNKSRQHVSNISPAIKTLAQNIVGDSKGWAAAKKIARWCDRWHYQYGLGFNRSVESVLKHKGGNCCSMTRAMLTLMDAAGVTEYVTLKYVHVCCGPGGVGHVYARLISKKTGTNRPVDCASDYHGAWGYICRNYRGRSESRSRYPKLPF
jgi:hypothetical protein